MKVLGFNGSPRRNWNTATLLQKALEGAASVGAETELVHLNDLRYRGCVSCFSCKTIGGKSYGSCATRDELTPCLEKVKAADAIILGSPQYLGSVTAAMKGFYERLVFPYYAYDSNITTLFARKIRTACIYTMNNTEANFQKGMLGFKQHIEGIEWFLRRTFGSCETLTSHNTYQFDYSKIYSPLYDVEKKIRRRQEVFPLDCQKAFEMGARLARPDST